MSHTRLTALGTFLVCQGLLILFVWRLQSMSTKAVLVATILVLVLVSVAKVLRAIWRDNPNKE